MTSEIWYEMIMGHKPVTRQAKSDDDLKIMVKILARTEAELKYHGKYARRTKE